MLLNAVTLTPSGQLEPLLKPAWLEINRLLAQSKTRQPTDTKILKDAQAAIFRGTPANEWPKDVAESFLNLGVRALRDVSPSPPLGSVELLVSFAQAGQLSESARLEVASLWLSTQLRSSVGSGFVPVAAVEAASAHLSVLGLSGDVLLRRLQAEIVTQIVSNGSQEPTDASHLDWARQACASLLEFQELRPMLADAASVLGIEISSAVPIPEDEPDVAGEASSFSTVDAAPTILPLPGSLSESEKSSTYGAIVFDLSAYATEPGTQLSTRTIDQVHKLDLDAPTGECNATLYFAALDIWRGYGSNGDRKLPNVVAAISEFLLSQVESAEQRANAMHLWVNANVARKIRTSALADLLKDANRVFVATGVRRNDLWIRQGFIEASAAECRAFDLENDQEARDQFIADNWPDLSAIHNDYLAKARSVRFDPRPDEQLAWDYLSSLSEKPEPTEPGIRNSPDFRKVINRGAADDIYQFAKDQNDKIQQILESRLGIRIGLEHVIEPGADVYDVNSRDRGTLHPVFVEAKRALAQGEFPKAAMLFERLSQRVGSGAFSQIARDYQGFALAKQGVQMPARLPLQEICQDGYTHPSAYWNLACCILPEEMDQQLEVLATGLRYAPHPKLLHAAVYVASFSNEPRLREWLPWLTLTEALLLFYKLDNEQRDLSAAERQVHVLRLARYALEGEPVMPDTASARVQDAEVQQYLNSLLERQQPGAFEFWLRCREVRFQKHYKHWEIKVDFLEKTERRAEAAKAFEEELKQRLRYFGILQGKNDRKRFVILRESATRLEKWLGLCMTPDLKGSGFRLFNTAKMFEGQYKGAVLLSKTPRILRYYSADSPAPSSEAQAPSAPPVDLAQLLVVSGAALQSGFKDLGDLPAIRYKLDDLGDGLGRAGDRASADALKRLVQLLEGYNRLANEAERHTALQKLQSTFADLRREFQKELTETQSTLAGPILATLKRVNEGIARDSKLLPDIKLDALETTGISIDPRAKAVFPIRVSVLGGEGVVRLTGATGLLDDGTTELSLRDKLTELDPLAIGPEKSAVLTLEAPGSVIAGTFREAKVTAEFEYAGGGYRTPTFALPLVASQHPELPPSPYIYNRSLEPEEIDGHFFGRGAEQDALLTSLRGGVLRYIEGIRRAGKSSLLRSIEHEITKRSLPFIPVYFSAGGASGVDHAGKLFFNLAAEICSHPRVKPLGIAPPQEQRCCDNLPNTYAQFARELGETLSGAKIVVLLDDFNQLIDTAAEARGHIPALHTSIIGLLNIIWSQANPRASLMWLFAGHKTLRQYKKDLPGPDLWGTLKPAPIDFLTVDAVGEIIRTPLGGEALVPDETVSRVHALTAGHPELVQKIAELMLNQARDEKRFILAPADADEATRYLALYSDDPFAGAWVPEAELRREPETLRLLAEFVRKVEVGGRSDLHTVLAPGEVTDKHKVAAEELKARKILHSFDAGLGVRARVLDLWLHHRMIKDVQFEEPGSPAIFVDVANLTGGRGSATLTDLDTAAGDGVAGRFGLGTAFDKIEKYVYELTKVPIATKWAVNYPPRCPAVMECVSKDYKIVHVPEDLFRKAQIQKGSDDTILQEQINEVEAQYPNVQHFFIITGDKDYRIKVSKLLERGKHVHVVSRASALGNPDTKYSYDTLARKYPERFTVKRLEELLEKQS